MTEREHIALRPPRHRLPRRAIGYWTARGVAGAAPLVAGLAVAYGLAEGARPWLGPALVVVVVAAAA